MPLNYPNRTLSQNWTVSFLYLWIITTRKIEPIGLNKKNSNFSRERKREKRSRDNKKKEALTTARPCHKEFACSRERGRDRLSEIIQNPIREVENPERDFSTDNIPLLPPPSPLPPHSEMKRKRDACNQADVDTEFRRGVPPPSIPEEGWKVSNMTRREQISRVLATPPVTTSQHHHGGCSHGDGGASILTLRGGNSREYLRLGRSFFPSSAFFLPLPLPFSRYVSLLATL